MSRSLESDSAAGLSRCVRSSISPIFTLDASIHGSHYPGAYTEAALTGVGAFVFSVVVSYTRIGAYIDRLAESFLEHQPHA